MKLPLFRRLFDFGLATHADLALTGGGVALAAASVAFAAVMLSAGDHEPWVNGMQDLAIFAKPNSSARAVVVAQADVGRREGADRNEAREIDLSPTGSIAPPAPQPSDARFVIAYARRDFAIVRSGAQMLPVVPGAIIGGLGQIGSIEQRTGRWVLLDPKGAVIAMDEAKPESEASLGSPRFSRNLIFDDRRNGRGR